MMFTPKWKKEAQLLYKSAKKFIHYKRDLIDEDRVHEIESRRADLKKAWKAGDREAAIEASKMLQDTCEKSLRHYHSPSALAENVEVLFVAIAIALGLRAYYLQPFRIPTGSMRPTLNGIIGHVEDKDQWPSFPVRAVQQFTHGRSYDSVINQKAGDRIVDIRQKQTFHFFTRTVVSFASGDTQSVSGSVTAFLETINRDGLEQLVGQRLSRNPSELVHQLAQIQLPKDFKVAEGYIETGDLVLVDKFSYHFRQPNAGEVFVFDTRKIKQIQEGENPGSHYIKRLIATPGQRVELQGGEKRDLSYRTNSGIKVMQVADQAQVFIDGAKMQHPGVLAVESGLNGYGGYQATARLAPGRSVLLADRPSTGKSEFWAQGDNSYNSSDSRMWGTVKEFNLVGPAAFVLWPFGSGHWGLIK
ncbi:signal peptidase I [Rubritalea marina]|uniref:signal peptidase I n=1 Tax=Rubritalea marina TaxID=361055 RepID=UPI000399C6AA|nr:signal peptidase I [Rubritalea marina]